MADFYQLKVGSTTYDVRDAQAVSADAIADAGKYKGAYSAAKTYATGEVVASGSTYYKSLQDSNTGHAVTDTAWWATYTATAGFLNSVSAFSSTVSDNVKTICASLNPSTSTIADVINTLKGTN